MITFTDTAITQLIKTLEPNEIIRVAVVGGGCSGMSYALNIETETDEEDILLDYPGVSIYLDPHSAGILKNTVVDYIITLQQQGFKFINKDANMTCGCGSSFN